MDPKDALNKVVSTGKLFGKSWIVQQAQSFLIPKVMSVFAEHDHEQLRRMILSNYELVENDLPEGYKNALRNFGKDSDTQELYEGIVRQYVTPDNVLKWLRNPEEWLSHEEAVEQREELRKCAEVIEETSGGRRWLDMQVVRLYEYAGIIPEGTGKQVAREQTHGRPNESRTD